MTRLGVAVKAGPEDRIFAMAKAAQQGKLDIGQLIQAFGIPRGQAAAMMSMLKQGPEKLQAIQKDTMTGADAIDDRTLETYRNMLQVRRELGDAWGDLVNVRACSASWAGCSAAARWCPVASTCSRPPAGR
jgi:hypothetical protein